MAHLHNGYSQTSGKEEAPGIQKVLYKCMCNDAGIPQPPGTLRRSHRPEEKPAPHPLAFLPCAWAVAVLWVLFQSSGAPYLINPGTKVDGQESLEPESSAP